MQLIKKTSYILLDFKKRNAADSLVAILITIAFYNVTVLKK